MGGDQKGRLLALVTAVYRSCGVRWSAVKSLTEQGIFKVIRLTIVVLAIAAVFALPALGAAALIIELRH